MNPKNRIALVLVAVAAALALFLFLRPLRDHQAQPLPIAVTAPEASPAIAVAPVMRAEEPGTEEISDDEKAERNEARPEAGGGENQLEHMLRSIVEANETELKLTPAQLDRLAFDYLEFQEIHAELAARFLQETSFDPASVTVRLPAYPVEGKALRDMFYGRLEKDFPAGKAAEIREHIGGFLDQAFHGFGITEQSFTITRNPDLQDAFEVRWEANAPEGAAAGTLNPDVNFAGGSGTSLLYREQLANGEFRFLGNVVERRFPHSTDAAAP